VPGSAERRPLLVLSGRSSAEPWSVLSEAVPSARWSTFGSR